MFPVHPPRRLRNHPQLRRMVRENIVNTKGIAENKLSQFLYLDR